MESISNGRWEGGWWEMPAVGSGRWRQLQGERVGAAELAAESQFSQLDLVACRAGAIIQAGTAKILNPPTILVLLKLRFPASP